MLCGLFLLVVLIYVFFFKQKTAYEMRISDWSSDVCSSDLYDNLQFQIFGPFGPQAFNADGATVQGIELEIRAAPTDWLQFDASGAYSDATFDPQVIPGAQLGGNRVQRTPEWTANLGASADFSLGSAGSGRFRLDYFFTLGREWGRERG